MLVALLSLLISQMFAFYLNQLLAVGSLLIDLLVLLTLNYMIARERSHREQLPGTDRPPSALLMDIRP